MLIRFTVENYRSFKNEVVFSMISGRSQQHDHHILDTNQGIDYLRLALVYGANASGKSNLVRAISFAQNFIVEGTRPKQAIQFDPFRLDRDWLQKPSKFEFEIAIREDVFAYGFVIDNKRVYEEWLYKVNPKTEMETLWFERKTVDKVKEIKFGKKIQIVSEEKQYLQFIAKGTRENELLLTALASREVLHFEPISDWFRNKLTIVFPDSTYKSLPLEVHHDKEFSEKLSKFLHQMNTGIDRIQTKKINIEETNLPKEIIDKLKQAFDEEVDLDDGKLAIVLDSKASRYLTNRNNDGEIEFFSLGTLRTIDGQEFEFDLFDESDGTQRLFDLFHVLHGSSDKVFIVDELERSLHPNLAHKFIEYFSSLQSKTQLIVTTHESALLNSRLIRRDEVWFTEKSLDGSSSLYSLEEYKTRNDLDIRKGYLNGRFGAVPIFRDFELELVEK